MCYWARISSKYLPHSWNTIQSKSILLLVCEIRSRDVLNRLSHCESIEFQFSALGGVGWRSLKSKKNRKVAHAFQLDVRRPPSALHLLVCAVVFIRVLQSPAVRRFLSCRKENNVTQVLGVYRLVRFFDQFVLWCLSWLLHLGNLPLYVE